MSARFIRHEAGAPLDVSPWPKVWFTGCTHFGHENIIRLANRPFASLSDMDEELILRWNAKVSDDDLVCHLGDFAWSEPAHYAQELNGNLIQIKGNHDKSLPWKMHDYLTIRRGDARLVLFHYPIEEWDGYFRGAIHLHCHTHSHERITAKQRFNVTVEANDYAPVSLDDILQQMETSA